MSRGGGQSGSARADGGSAIWRPFTQMKGAPEPLPVRSARGAYLELEDGRRILDCISSWWVTLHGHGEPSIARAISQQSENLEHVLAAGFTHEPAEALTRELLEVLPASVQWVFYSDNGSTAVEVAMKLAIQYWKNLGETGRTRFLSFERAYHGDTIGAMSVSDRSVFTRPFESLLCGVDHVPFPSVDSSDDGLAEEREAETIAALEETLTRNPGLYAAMVIEPLVQGAGGMRMCRTSFMARLQELLRTHGVLAIYDEVMVGLGRTGDWFASTKAGTEPDLICLAKALTGGFLPMAATACSDAVFRAFFSDDPRKAFYHGHSYTANPLGCAAALTSLGLLKEGEARFRGMEAWHRRGLAGLQGHPMLSNFRTCGTIAALDLTAGEPGYLNQMGALFCRRLLERGILLRPLGNVLYLMPPYCIDQDELDRVYAQIGEVAESLL